MVLLGVTGHIDLHARSVDRVFGAIIETIGTYADQPIRGITCLAEGADQIFAAAILAQGGKLDVILPARDYRDRIIPRGRREQFDFLLNSATNVSHIPFEESSSAAYAAANAEMLRQCDRLLAIWDGQRTGGTAGTAEVVGIAESLAIPVTRIWPPGARRRSHTSQRSLPNRVPTSFVDTYN
jgi:hypothetical protein